MKQGDLLQIVRESMSLDESRNPENEPINKIIRGLGEYGLLSNKEKKILEANGIEILGVADDGWTALRGSNGEVIDSDEIEDRIAESNGDFDFYNWLTNERNSDWDDYDYNDPTKMSYDEYKALQPYRNEKHNIKIANGEIMSANNEIKKAKSNIRKAKKDKASILAKARANHKKNESMSLHEARNPENIKINRFISNLGKINDDAVFNKEETKFLEKAGIKVEYNDFYGFILTGPNGNVLTSQEIFDWATSKRHNAFDFYNYLTSKKSAASSPEDELDSLQPYRNEKEQIKKSNAEIRRAQNRKEKAIASVQAKRNSRKNESFRINESASGTWSDALWDAVDEELVDAKDLCFSFIKYLSEDEVEDFCRYNDLTDLVEKMGYGDLDESCSKKSKVSNNEKMNEDVNPMSDFEANLEPAYQREYREADDDLNDKVIQYVKTILSITDDVTVEDLKKEVSEYVYNIIDNM